VRTGYGADTDGSHAAVTHVANDLRQAAAILLEA
jgi:hypothetical protein